MTINSLTLGQTEWLDIVNPTENEIDQIIEKYGFHELDREAITEEYQLARVDTYDDYIFVVLHFPKYDTKSRRYLANEFNIFISRNYLINFRYYNTSSVDAIMDRYSDGKHGKDVINTGYMLYDLIDSMLDGTLKILNRFGKDLRSLEVDIFRNVGEKTISEIMIRKRNMIALKHMISPQIQVLKVLELRMNALFKDDEVEVYFENLEDKVQKIYSEIQLLQENIDSMEDTLKSIFDMQTNNTIKYLTFFSAFMLPLTLITSFFGMNIENVPFHDNMVYMSIVVTAIVMGVLVYVLKKWKKL
ncbi:MAG: magnesium transporter CorA family protein [Candidatus Gracilibacteria bacterium]|nr:magnesium transporter CorA family protein [Candidatus Gracilibacteria bacterium]